MKISYKIVGITVLISLILIVFGSFLFESFFRTYLIGQENEQIRSNISSISSELQAIESKYKTTVNDWAHWDETYNYINTKDTEYVRENVNESSITVLDLNIMLYLDNNNNVVNKFNYDLEKKEFSDFPSGLIASIENYINIHTEDGDASFITEYNNKFYYMSTSEITDSFMEKQKNGTLVFGRLIDENMLERLGELISAKITFSSVDDLEKSVADRLTKQEATNSMPQVTIIDEKSNTLTVYLLKSDSLNSQYPVALTITKTRRIYESGIKQLRILQMMYSLFIISIIIMMFLGIHFFISKPILGITSYLNNINLSENKSYKLPVVGNDEFSIIAKSINNMLGKIGAQHADLRQSEERLRIAQAIAHVGNWELDLRSKKVIASDECLSIYGIDHSISELSLKHILKTVMPKYRRLIINIPKQLNKKQGKYELEYKINRISDGEERYLYLRSGLIYNKFGEPDKVFGIVHDITERKKHEEKNLYNSYHDSLTGLYNRRFLDEQIERLDNPKNLPISIIIGDVNGLKLTNDVYGHQMGDKVLKTIAEIIKKICRPKDIAARWGGDEFIILLPNSDSDETKNIVDKIRYECLNSNVATKNVSISLGFFVKKTTADSIDTVIKNAEDYMYKNKLFETSSMRGRTIDALLSTLYEKNPREEAHSRRVSEICISIGTAMGLSETEINKLKFIGLVHDIGKIALDEEVLNKPSKLTDRERKEIERHPEIGYRILSTSGEMSSLAKYILMHHERIDGLGYPKGLTGEKIPLKTRILTVADSYDAMTSDRPYRGAFNIERAIEELKKNAGTQFDADVVDVFINKVLNQKVTSEVAQKKSNDDMLKL